MTIIQPIDSEREQQIIAEVHRYIDNASELYQRSFDPIEVVFNIKGQAAGMYRHYYKKQKKSSVNLFKRWSATQYRQIRFNPWLFAKYPEDSWSNTIPHEVAHYITDCCYGLKNIKPHGVEWQRIMRDFNAVPVVKGDYSLEGIPVRRTRYYHYHCGCRQIDLSSIRHRKIQSGQQEYRCQYCAKTLTLCDGEGLIG